MSAVVSPVLEVAPVIARRRPARPCELAGLVQAAACGHDAAWNELVRRTGPIVRRALARMMLSRADLEDVLQGTWLRAYTRLHTLREPEAFVGWIVVTARRLALYALQRRAQEILVEDFAHLEQADEANVDCAIERERRGALYEAVARLPAHERRLLEWMLDHPGDNYAEIAARLEIPIGSIGPTRQRALARMRHDDRFLALTTA